jgi:1,6-anhydro-N-acetylmuramate kinase
MPLFCFIQLSNNVEDVQRTLLELTAMSVSASIPTGTSVYLCGGGVHNLFLFERLICQNPDSKVTLTNDLGVSADYVEIFLIPLPIVSITLVLINTA